MAEIKLSNGMIAHVDDEDLPKVKGYRWRLYKHGSQRHIITDVQLAGSKTSIRLARVILGASKGKKCVHRDGNFLNNRRENLKLMSPRVIPKGYTRYLMRREAIEEERHTQL